MRRDDATTFKQFHEESQPAKVVAQNTYANWSCVRPCLVAFWLSDNGIDHKTKVTLNGAQLVLRYGLPFPTSKANKLHSTVWRLRGVWHACSDAA